MEMKCSVCGHENMAGRIVCQHCLALLLSTMPRISDKDAGHIAALWRRIVLFGASVTPFVLLYVYGIFAGKNVF
jgi:hypothetical protein